VPEENKVVVSPSRADIVGVEDAAVFGLDVKLAHLGLLQRTCGEIVDRYRH